MGQNGLDRNFWRCFQMSIFSWKRGKNWVFLLWLASEIILIQNREYKYKISTFRYNTHLFGVPYRDIKHSVIFFLDICIANVIHSRVYKEETVKSFSRVESVSQNQENRKISRIWCHQEKSVKYQEILWELNLVRCSRSNNLFLVLI